MALCSSNRSYSGEVVPPPPPPAPFIYSIGRLPVGRKVFGREEGGWGEDNNARIDLLPNAKWPQENWEEDMGLGKRLLSSLQLRVEF